MSIFNKIKKEWTANFSELIEYCDDIEINTFCDKFYEAYCRQYDSADYLKFVEWILRHYQSSKRLILSALFYKQSEFLLDKQVDNLVFYTMYYSLFNAFSANIMQIPYLPLNSIVKISHSKVFNEIHNYLAKQKIYDETFHIAINGVVYDAEDPVSKVEKAIRDIRKAINDDSVDFSAGTLGSLCVQVRIDKPPEIEYFENFAFFEQLFRNHISGNFGDL